MIDAATIGTMYDTLGEPVFPAVGDPLLGLFSVADVEVFGDVQAGEYRLRYPTGSASLAEGDQLTIRGRLHRVVEAPARINDGLEMLARLAEV